MRATQIFRQSMPARGNNSARGADGRHSRCPLLFNGHARAPHVDLHSVTQNAHLGNGGENLSGRMGN